MIKQSLRTLAATGRFKTVQCGEKILDWAHFRDSAFVKSTLAELRKEKVQV